MNTDVYQSKKTCKCSFTDCCMWGCLCVHMYLYVYTCLCVCITLQRNTSVYA